MIQTIIVPLIDRHEYHGIKNSMLVSLFEIKDLNNCNLHFSFLSILTLDAIQ